jgi:hypothetical protein
MTLDDLQALIASGGSATQSKSADITCEALCIL